MKKAVVKTDTHVLKRPYDLVWNPNAVLFRPHPIIVLHTGKNTNTSGEFE